MENEEDVIKKGDLVRIIEHPIKKYVGKIAEVVSVTSEYSTDDDYFVLYKLKYYKTIIPMLSASRELLKII